MIIQNATAVKVSGQINLFDASGDHIASVPFTINPFAVNIIYSDQAAPNSAGSATVTHDAGWGDLTGQTVRIQTGIGWAFYTPMEVEPR